MRLHGIEKRLHHRVLMHHIGDVEFAEEGTFDIKNQACSRITTFNEPGFIDRQYTLGNMFHHRFEVVSL